MLTKRLRLDSHKVKYLRQKQGITQKHMAGLFNLSLAGYARKELGDRLFYGHEIIKLAKILGVPPEELYIVDEDQEERRGTG